MDRLDIEFLWQRCQNFHGHACGGLFTGFLASLYAYELLDLELSQDEGILCISENDTCAVDAIQTVLGCTVGRGNLLFHMTGKPAFSFYNRDTGKSVRLVRTGDIPDPETINVWKYIGQCHFNEIFTAKKAMIPIPEKARIFDTYICERCGEKTGANWIHIQDGKMLCGDCYVAYDRFNI